MLLGTDMLEDEATLARAYNDAGIGVFQFQKFAFL